MFCVTLDKNLNQKGIKPMSHSDTHRHEHKPFSAPLFIITIATSLGLYLVALKFIAPATWDIQWRASISAYIYTFLACHFFNAIFEHLFHRYVLHCPLIPGLATFYKSHTRHHGLTRITWRKVGVENYYPIIEEKQYEDSFFPWYSYGIFILLLTVLFVPIQWMLPSAPIFVGAAFALTFSISLYELLHALEHRSLDWWTPKIEHPNVFIRKFWRIAYAFHLRHHADIKCNEGISGFFGIPIADFLFGTWVNPRTMYKHGEYLNIEEFKSPTPVFFIRWIDAFAEQRIKQRRLVRQK